jgi:hypothetical protein
MQKNLLGNISIFRDLRPAVANSRYPRDAIFDTFEAFIELA